MKTLVIFLGITALALFGESRLWTNKENGKSFYGEYCSQVNDEVSIKRKRDGKAFNIAKTLLSEEDLEWLSAKSEAEEKEASARLLSGDYSVTDKGHYQIDIKFWFKVIKEAAGRKIILNCGIPVSGRNIHPQRVLAPTRWKMTSEHLGNVEWEEIKPGKQDKYDLRQYKEGVSRFKIIIPDGLPAGSKHQIQFRHFVELGRVKFKPSMKQVSMENLATIRESAYKNYFKPYEGEWPKPELLKEILGGKDKISERSIYKNMRLIYKKVLERMEYVSPVPDKSLEALSTTFRGDCGSYSKLINALGRQAGIPCRTVSGYTFERDAKFEEGSDKRLRHAWGEFFVPNFGWVPFDGSFGDGRRDSDDFFGKLNDRDSRLRLVNTTHNGTQANSIYYSLDGARKRYSGDLKLFGKEQYYTIEVSKYENATE